jgi:hypothetical protein
MQEASAPLCKCDVAVDDVLLSAVKLQSLLWRLTLTETS